MSPNQLTDSDFSRLSGLVHDLTGVTVDGTKRSMLSSRIRRRLRALELDTFHEYIQRLASGDMDPEEIEVFIQTVTTHTTSFFRTPSVWDFLEEEFRSERFDGRDVAVWSAASSTGQEPFSLAMLLRAVRGRDARVGRWSVTASDVSALTVEQARAGRFDRADVEAAAAARPAFDALGCFELQEEAAVATRELASAIDFRTHNLLDPMQGRFDAVLLRNVIIYFSEADTQRVIDHATAAIRPGGLLVIGEAESLVARGGGLEFEAPCIYRKK
ncbi:MAG: CheR family methyltransferase [Planctomycetota bacterium]